MDNPTAIDKIEEAASQRGDPKVPRDYISEALASVAREQRRNHAEGITNYKYPTSEDVYKIAAKLYADSLK
jgi:hypothetical protein